MDNQEEKIRKLMERLEVLESQVKCNHRTPHLPFINKKVKSPRKRSQTSPTPVMKTSKSLERLVHFKPHPPNTCYDCPPVLTNTQALQMIKNTPTPLYGYVLESMVTNTFRGYGVQEYDAFVQRLTEYGQNVRVWYCNDKKSMERVLKNQK